MKKREIKKLKKSEKTQREFQRNKLNVKNS